MPHDSFPPALLEREAAELKAQHLACTQLVRGCQDAILEFRKQATTYDDDDRLRLSHRTIDILEGILESWCETLSIVRSALDQTSSPSHPLEYGVRGYPGIVTADNPWMSLAATRPTAGQPNRGGLST